MRLWIGSGSSDSDSNSNVLKVITKPIPERNGIITSLSSAVIELSELIEIESDRGREGVWPQIDYMKEDLMAGFIVREAGGGERLTEEVIVPRGAAERVRLMFSARPVGNLVLEQEGDVLRKLNE